MLHVENGRDIFITVFGEFKPCVFGFRLETLIKLTKPLSEYELPVLMAIDRDTDSLNQPENRKAVPTELWLLMDCLYKHGLEKKDLFTLNRKYKGDPRMNEIRDWLDSWSTKEFRECLTVF